MFRCQITVYHTILLPVYHVVHNFKRPLLLSRDAPLVPGAGGCCEQGPPALRMEGLVYKGDIPRGEVARAMTWVSWMLLCTLCSGNNSACMLLCGGSSGCYCAVAAAV